MKGCSITEDTTPRRGLEHLSDKDECDMILSLTVAVHGTIAKPYSLDRVSVEEV